ncbi:hypothetical protein FQA39_LY09097 [Lamprigera yunnana]|nr:hypothetical protein FQA39_LY09097 [Lamprigera yunnana]
METRNTKQKPRETEEQEKIQILQEEELEEPTKIEERSNNCKEDKLMQMLLQMNSAMLNKFEENNQKFEETNKTLEENNQKLEEKIKKMLNKFEENNKKLDKTRAEIRTEMNQSMKKIQRLFNTIQEKIDEKWEKNYVDFDCKMVDITEQVDNNSEHINDNCKDLKRTEKENIVNFKEPQKGFMKNYWGIKEESVMKSELYGTKFNHSLRQLEQELLNKDRIIEVKKFDEVVRRLEIHYQCGKDGLRNDGNEYYNHYNNYEQGKYNYSGQGRNNHNYSQGPYQGNQFYHYHKNRNSKSCGRNVNIKKIIQQPRKNVDTIKRSEDHQDSDDDKEKEKCEIFMLLSNLLRLCLFLSFLLSISNDYLFPYQLPNDMENYMKYHLMGSVSQVRMKPGCIPTKFACQPGRKTGTSVERQYIRKKRKMMAIEECEKQLEESNRVTEHFDFEDIASRSSSTYLSRFM